MKNTRPVDNRMPSQHPLPYRSSVCSGIASRLPSTHRPRLRQWEKGGYAASTPERYATGYMPMLGPLSLSRLLLRCWASLACSCWCLTTSGWVNTALTVRAT